MTHSVVSAALLAKTHKQLIDALLKRDPVSPDEYAEKFSKQADEFADKLSDYAQRVADGDMSPAQFRAAMERTIASNYEEAYRLGLGSSASVESVLEDEHQAVIDTYFQEERDYLSSFADDIAENDFSEAYLLNRVSLYADSIRGLYWAGQTAGYPPETQVTWVANDDDGTCDSCHDMADGSPYTPDELDGQMPGADVCEGLDRCRCELEYEVPDIESDDNQDDTMSEDDGEDYSDV